MGDVTASVKLKPGLEHSRSKRKGFFFLYWYPFKFFYFDNLVPKLNFLTIVSLNLIVCHIDTVFFITSVRSLTVLDTWFTREFLSTQSPHPLDRGSLNHVGAVTTATISDTTRFITVDWPLSCLDSGSLNHVEAVVTTTVLGITRFIAVDWPLSRAWCRYIGFQ